MKRLNVSIEDDLHKKLKMAVAESGITIGKFVEEAIVEKLESSKKEQTQKQKEN